MKSMFMYLVFDLYYKNVTPTKLVRSPGENGEGYAQKDLHSRTGRDEAKGKTQERMETGRRKRSSSAGSEKMEKVGDG